MKYLKNLLTIGGGFCCLVPTLIPSFTQKVSAIALPTDAVYDLGSFVVVPNANTLLKRLVLLNPTIFNDDKINGLTISSSDFSLGSATLTATNSSYFTNGTSKTLTYTIGSKINLSTTMQSDINTIINSANNPFSKASLSSNTWSYTKVLYIPQSSIDNDAQGVLKYLNTQYPELNLAINQLNATINQSQYNNQPVEDVVGDWFYGNGTITLTPKDTSNIYTPGSSLTFSFTTDAFPTTASSEQITGNYTTSITSPNPSYPNNSSVYYSYPYLAFDKRAIHSQYNQGGYYGNGSGWLTQNTSNAQIDNYIYFSSSIPIKVKSYKTNYLDYFSGVAVNGSGKWIFQASNDNSTWVTLDDQSSPSGTNIDPTYGYQLNYWLNDGYFYKSINNDTAYNYFRIRTLCGCNTGSNYPYKFQGFSEIALFE